MSNPFITLFSLLFAPTKSDTRRARGFELIQVALILIIVFVAYGVISGLWEQIWQAVSDKLSNL